MFGGDSGGTWTGETGTASWLQAGTSGQSFAERDEKRENCLELLLGCAVEIVAPIVSTISRREQREGSLYFAISQH